MPPKIDRLDTTIRYKRQETVRMVPAGGGGGGYVKNPIGESGILDGPHRSITLEVVIYQEPSRHQQGQYWVAPDAEEVVLTLDQWLKFALKDDWFVAWVTNTTVEDDETPWDVVYKAEGDEEPSVFHHAQSKADAVEYIERHQGGLVGRLSAQPATWPH